MVKKQAILLLKVLVSVLLLTYIGYKAGLGSAEGRAQIWGLVTEAQPYFVLASVVVGVLQLFAGNWKWWILLRSRDSHVPIGLLFAYYMIGRFYNLVLPTSVGGDVVRILSVGKHTGKNAGSFAAVFIERYTGLITLVLVSLLVLLVGGDQGISIFSTSIIFISTLVIIITWVIYDDRLFVFFTKLGRRFGFLHGLISKVEKAHAAVVAYKGDWKTLLWVFAISSVFYFLAVFAVWTAARAFSPDVSLEDMFLAVPAIMLIMNLPVSIGGLGLMEAAYTLTFTAFGYSPQLGFTVALFMRLMTILYAVAGGVVQFFVPQFMRKMKEQKEQA